VLNVVFTVPAILYIDRWGRRPMLLIGTLLMGFWMFLVGGIQARFGHWGADGNWVIENNQAATRAVIVCSYLFVSRYVLLIQASIYLGSHSYSFAITMGPVSWTYPAEIFSLRVRGKAVSLSTVCPQGQVWRFKSLTVICRLPTGHSTLPLHSLFLRASTP